MTSGVPIAFTRIVNGDASFFNSFSPGEYFQQGDRQYQIDEFMERVFNKCIVDELDIKKHQLGDIMTPLAERSHECYFYAAPACQDDAFRQMVFMPSVKFHDMQQASVAHASYMVYQSCTHEFV